MPRRACSTRRIQLTIPSPHRNEPQCVLPAFAKAPAPHKVGYLNSAHRGYASAHDKNTDPTTTPAPAQREAITVLARPTIRAPTLPPTSVREIRPPTRRNAKDPSCLHDSALLHHNPARRAPKVPIDAPANPPTSRLTLTPETPSTVNHAETHLGYLPIIHKKVIHDNTINAERNGVRIHPQAMRNKDSSRIQRVSCLPIKHSQKASVDLSFFFIHSLYLRSNPHV